ncbi:MAG: HAMP domain-containing sensor histidine kinase [Actinomycetaceae bacterium]|nr:HAMP domain-containing sensor histidine kinase [Actinomycetaceae bacterium]
MRGRWHQITLSLRLVVVTTTLLMVGLALAGATIMGVLQTHLTRQVDESLQTSAARLAVSSARSLLQNLEPALPSDYYVRVHLVDGDDRELISEVTKQVAGTPRPGKILRDSEVPQGSMTRPVSVKSTKAGVHWRAVAVPIYQGEERIGVVTVALPLIGVSRTISNVTWYLLFSSASLMFLGAIAAYYLVRRELRPLRAIEQVAGRIAEGDLTQRVALEPRQTEIGSLGWSLNKMLSQIEQSFADRAKSEQKMQRFVSDASHELRTPLATLRGYGELYRMGAVPPERVPEVMGRIESEATRMTDLVNDLLKLARLDESRPMNFEQTDLTELCRLAALDMEALDRTRTVTVISLDGDHEVPPIFAVVDRNLIAQVLTNLSGNITRYTPQGTPVEFAIGTGTDCVVIEVRDHGPGIAPEEWERVFERFYRSDTSRARATGGSGLGLAIVNAIVNAHGGTAHMDHTEDGGLTVRLTLPKVAPAANCD